MRALTIFFVDNQETITKFYKNVLNIEPTLDVPGMVEFTLPDKTMIGFMPAAGIKRLLGEKIPDPSQASGIPRAELYLMVTDAASYHARAIKNGAREIQSMQSMPWGEDVAYSLDPDGHILAFAEAVDSASKPNE